MAHNQVIETMFHSIVSLTFELMLRSLGDPTVSRAGVPYHAQILAALRDGDAARARQAVEDHLLVAGRLYGSDLDQNLDLMARRELERFVGPSVSLESILDTVAAEVARASEREVAAVEEMDQ
jgi:GntR family transcriptional repressor for pyruvate dehydrogenase complex